MEIKLYQIDAFANTVFKGNSAAVCPLNEWISEELMQKIAMENNLSETAFIVKEGEVYHIRWFTPTVEVALCGHATLAAAHVLYEHLGYTKDEIIFTCLSGELKVKKEGKLICMNFPIDPVEEVALSEVLTAGFTEKPLKAYKSKKFYMLEFEKEEQIATMKPDIRTIGKIEGVGGIIVTAPGDKVDFVSRFFGPQSGIDEDPVTGSAHTTLTPFWAKKLGKNEMNALQLSARVGVLKVKNLANRVEISGEAVTYMAGSIIV